MGELRGRHQSSPARRAQSVSYLQLGWGPHDGHLPMGALKKLSPVTIDPSSGWRVVLPHTSDGQRLDRAGRYELLTPIARGGMGAVWSARLGFDDDRFEKLVAVKTLLPHLAHEPGLRALFLAEAQVVAGLEHPNVARALDVGEEGELLYLVMEWVEGESLHALARAAAARNMALPLGVILRVLADACAGLHAVHEHTDFAGRPLDIVHRDVSPHNLLVSVHGITKLIDFGVAQSRERVEVTGLGDVKGKVRFMAPEQACGGHVDRRADVWAVGAVLYKLVTGQYVYRGQSDVEFLRMMTSGRPPEPVPYSIPEPLARVLRRALSFAPAGRYATCAELGEELDRAARELGVETDARGVAAALQTFSSDTMTLRRETIREALGERLASAPPRAMPTLVDEDDPTAIDLGSIAHQRRRVAPSLVAAGMALVAVASFALGAWLM